MVMWLKQAVNYLVEWWSIAYLTVITTKLNVSLLYLGATINPTVKETKTVESCISEAPKGESCWRVWF